MFHRILVPVDLGEASSAHVQYAALFARRFGAEITLLYADEVAALFGGFDSEFVGMHIPAGEQVAKQENLLRSVASRHAGGIPSSVVAIPGPAVATIVRIAEETKPDLVVMGSHGGTSWRRAITGSVADGVIRAAMQPVLVIPPGFFPESIGRVVCPVNFTLASRDALDIAARLAGTFDAELLLVHVHEADGLDNDLVHDRLRSYVPQELRTRCKMRELILRGGPAERVIDCVEAERADLLVMGTQVRELRAQTIIGTTAERLLHFSPVPVLTVTHKHVDAVEESEPVTASYGV
ncbi:MAG TPA: universal stress protein [Thermoanaerobaculia bacterium]|nr:universal stress protein [Thermoanaerobaculia bacterium]